MRLESSKQMAAKVTVPGKDSSVLSQGPGRVQIESVGTINGDHEFKRGALEMARLAFDLPPRTSPPSKLDPGPFEVHCTG